MKRHLKTIGVRILFLGLAGLAFTLFMIPAQTMACGGGASGSCGWGSQGGGDYVPQRRGSGEGWLGPRTYQSDRGPDLTKEQAYDILASHVAKLNPALKVGPLEDAGSFYKADILAEGKGVVDRLAVDKQSGRMMPVN